MNTCNCDNSSGFNSEEWIVQRFDPLSCSECSITGNFISDDRSHSGCNENGAIFSEMVCRREMNSSDRLSR